MTVLIFLTVADADTGPFDLFSNADNYAAKFETNISKAVLVTSPGFLTSNVPDAATIVRVQSVGSCTSHVDIVLTKIPPVPCGATSSSGGAGIAERLFDLSSEGGVLILAVNGIGVPDKFEIIHNGVKKATSGMTVANSGPFDPVYGTPPSNVVPTTPQTMSVDQFIGTDKTPDPPTRDAAFVAANPTLGYIVAAPKQQLVWWNYTPFDYQTSPQAILRITGPSGTGWDFIRKCETTSSTTTPTP